MSKLYVSADIEGVAGVVNWDQIMPGQPEYELGRRLLIEELNCLCRGAAIAGAQEIVVNDAHGPMRNIVPDQLHTGVRLITGQFKPIYMVEGLDESFDGAVFLAYHGPIGSSSVLSHTYNPRVIYEARLDGQVTGETGINALVAHYYNVPVILITGDDLTIRDATRWIPEAQGVEVKRSISRFSANALTPEEARALIFDAIQNALDNLPQGPFRDERAPSLELTFQSADMAILATWVGAQRIDDRKVVIEATNGLDLYQKFHSVLILARTVVDS